MQAIKMDDEDRTVACQTMALWDLFDLPPGDDDAVFYQTQREIVRVLDEYENGICILDRCIGELGQDALNHHDFAFHWRAVQESVNEDNVDDIDVVYVRNSISGGAQ